ncbi:MAG: pseudouridine synthase [Gammaproteobacteria bacterium]|nr:pseudouridine synthase [Gammaproteobacteria bacterium]
MNKQNQAGPGERIQKLLAQAGYGSRREIEGWIREGLIKVDGYRAELGQRIHATNRVEIRGRRINLSQRLNIPERVLLYNKQVGEIVARRDPEGRPLVFSRFPKPERGRWITVGRLDINSEGLLLATTNGELANQLMHPSSELEREYAVRVLGEITEDMAQCLLAGVELDDGVARFKRINFSGGEGANKWYHVTLSQGRNRVVRRLMESQGLQVSRLQRIRYGSVRLPSWLRTGQSTELSDKEIKRLKQTLITRDEAADC